MRHSQFAAAFVAAKQKRKAAKAARAAKPDKSRPATIGEPSRFSPIKALFRALGFRPSRIDGETPATDTLIEHCEKPQHFDTAAMQNGPLRWGKGKP